MIFSQRDAFGYFLARRRDRGLGGSAGGSFGWRSVRISSFYPISVYSEYNGAEKIHAAAMPSRHG